jgi:colicin import membrane protein
LLEQGRERLEAGALTEAFQRLAEVRALRPADAEADALEQALSRAANDRAEYEKREAAVALALSQAREALDAGAFDAAVEAAAEALARDPGHAEAQALHDRAAGVLEERHALEERQRAASEVVSHARAEFAGGNHQQALQRLREAAPHELVQAALDELEPEASTIAERSALDERAREAVAAARADFDARRHAQAIERLRGAAPHALVEDALAGLERAMGDIAEQQRREAAEADRRAEAEGQRRRRAIAAQATAARHAMNEGDFQDAIETLEHALRREPDSPELAALLLEARAGLAAGLQ